MGLYVIVNEENKVIGWIDGELPPVSHPGCKYLPVTFPKEELKYVIYDSELDIIKIDEQAKLNEEKQKLIARLKQDVKQFIEYKPDGTDRYTLEKQISFNAILQMCQIKLSDPNISDEKKQAYQECIQRIQQCFSWIQSVLDYHYQIEAKINEASSLEDLNLIEYDFTSFESTDPDLHLSEIMGVLT